MLYLGVLYHHGGLRCGRAAGACMPVTRELAIVETEAVAIPAFDDEALWRFFPRRELNGDVSNCGRPPVVSSGGALQAAASRGAPGGGPSEQLLASGDGPHHYRAVVHAAADGRLSP